MPTSKTQTDRRRAGGTSALLVKCSQDVRHRVSERAKGVAKRHAALDTVSKRVGGCGEFGTFTEALLVFYVHAHLRPSCVLHSAEPLVAIGEVPQYPLHDFFTTLLARQPVS
jgi:hypothetical protein